MFNKGDRVQHRDHWVIGTVVDHHAITVNVQWDRPCNGQVVSVRLPRLIAGNDILKPAP